MGKNLKGKECGKGICQRKDGLYSARYVDELGKRHSKSFPTLPEARNWLKQARGAPIPQDDLLIPNEMTADTWFEFWINNIVGDLAPNTCRNYRERCTHNTQPVIGKMRLSDVKPLCSKTVLSRMEATYAGSTIRRTYIAMSTMFRAARDKWEKGRKSDTLSNVLKHIDLRTGQKNRLVMSDLVFIYYRTGEPAKNSSYDTHLYKL